MKKIVVTGATGVIGRALIKICINFGYEVLAVVHKSSTRFSELENIDNCCVLPLNLDEYEHAVSEMKKHNISVNNYDLFFHLAWIAPFGDDRNNVKLQLENINASINAVKFAKELGCSTFIGVGSQAEYGSCQEKLSPQTPVFPETGYGISKLCSGQLTRLYCEQLGIRHIWCRVLSVYGPYDREQTLISYAISKMINNEDTEFTLCDQIWDYIYSDDAARAILLAALQGENGKVFVIGSGEAHPLREYIEKIAEITGYSKPIGFGKRAYNNNQVMFLQADNEELKGLGFRCRISFDKGIKEIIKTYFRS